MVERLEVDQVPIEERVLVVPLHHIAEISEQVAEHEGFSDELIGIMHGDSSQSEIDYRLGWVRWRLKEIGALVNSSREYVPLQSRDV